MIRVAIVDDEILARVGIQSLLESCEDIQVAGSFGVAEEAFKFLRTNLVDIVITDIEMPIMDGHRLTKLIKSDEETKDIPVVIFSSLVNEEMKRKGAALGANAQLSKPEIGNLVRTVDELVLNLK